MKAEKIYELCIKMKESVDKSIDEGMFTNIAKAAYEQLLLCAEKDMIAAINKSSGRFNIQKGCEVLIKKAENQKLKGMSIINGKQYCSDGHMMVELNTPIETQYDIPSEKYIKADRIMDTNFKAKSTIKTPSLADVEINMQKGKVLIEKLISESKNKYEKIKSNYYIVFVVDGEMVYVINPEYLILTAKILGDCEKIYIGDRNNDAVFMENELGRSLILPIRMNGNFESGKFYVVNSYTENGKNKYIQYNI